MTPKIEYYQRSEHQIRTMLLLAKNEESRIYWSLELARVQAKIAIEAWRFAETVTERRAA